MRTKKTQNDLSYSLFGKTRRMLLGLLYGHPDTAFYVRELVRAADAGVGSVQRELRQLYDAGIIERIEQGKQVYYKANAKCSIFTELKNLIVKTDGLTNIIKTSLAGLKDDIDLAFIYGSQAASTATSTSDIDVMVIGNVDELALHKAVLQAEESLSRSINYTLMSKSEFKRRRNERGGFIERIFAGPRIILSGSDDEI